MGLAVLGGGSSMMVTRSASAETTAAPAGGAEPSTNGKNRDLQAAVDAVQHAGMPGVFAEVREGPNVWRGVSGVADVETGRPVTADMRHRVGSITKTFTAAAVMRQVESGRVELDAPISRYLPRLVPGERGDKITVRMLLNHTSGLPDYLPYAFPSLQAFPAPGSTSSLDDNRFTSFSRRELIKTGVEAPAGGEPGNLPGLYSNTNYLILGELLEQVTGAKAEECITRQIIEPAGLQDTEFPTEARIDGPHSRMYESFFGLIDPPRDYSDYNMSWVSTGAGLVSTVEEMNRFYRLLLNGKIVTHASLEQMQRTVPVISQTGEVITYGLGLHEFTLPDRGTFWGHDGTVWGAQTMALASADGKRQIAVAMNLARWNTLDDKGQPQPHPIDRALSLLYQEAMRG
jgi:D-alanyl-D-alanine carboxypeptidase